MTGDKKWTLIAFAGNEGPDLTAQSESALMVQLDACLTGDQVPGSIPQHMFSSRNKKDISIFWDEKKRLICCYVN